jgi:hypothetical protein
MARSFIAILAFVLSFVTLDPRVSATVAGNAWLLVVDDLHIDFANTGRLRSLLRAVAGQLIRDGDAYQLSPTGPSAGKVPMAMAPTVDRALLDGAIKNTIGNGLKDADAMGPAADELLVRATRALDAFDVALSALIAEGGSRKAIIHASKGYNIDVFPAIADRIAALTRRAREGGVTIFSVDARFFDLTSPPDLRLDPAWSRYVAATRRSLEMIAEPTGGFVMAMATPDGTWPGLQRIDAQMRQ